MDLGIKIKERRKALDISVPKLARILHIPKDRIYQWESGRANPKEADALIIEQWLSTPIENVTYDSLVTKKDMIYLKATSKIQMLHIASLESKLYNKSLSLVFSTL